MITLAEWPWSPRGAATPSGLCKAAALGATLALFCPGAQAASMDPPGIRLANFILGLQDASGAIPDERDGELVNEDSNMEYALIGLAAAYGNTRDPRYLTGFERGFEWLFARQDLSDSPWNGSWRGAYSAAPPYDPVPRPSEGVRDFRGVDTTSALPAYLLYLHARVTGSDYLAKKWEANARAGLDFVLRENLALEGLPGSSWQLKRGSPEKLQRRYAKTYGNWVFWDYQYTSDLTDDYLGFRAGCRLYADPRYCAMADAIQAALPRFFDRKAGRFFEGLDSGEGQWEKAFDGTFAALYPLWVFGPTPETLSTYRWALRKVRPNGRLAAYPGDPGYSLAGCMFLLGSQALGQPEPPQVAAWLQRNITLSGGMRDTRSKRAPAFNNVAGLCAAAFLGLPAL